MGFISTGETNGMVIYFTPKGMEYLTGKKTSSRDLSIRYFSLGDSDTNYLTQKKSFRGFIPDLSGDDVACLKNVALDINNAIMYETWVNMDANTRPELPPSFHKSPIKK